MVQGVKLRYGLEKVFLQIESWSGKPVRVDADPSFPCDKGQALWESGDTPILTVSANGTTEAVIGHEIHHLLLRIYGYPNNLISGYSILDSIDNFFQHHVLYGKYVQLVLRQISFSGSYPKLFRAFDLLNLH
jgi:hypothetical protein